MPGMPDAVAVRGEWISLLIVAVVLAASVRPLSQMLRLPQGDVGDLFWTRLGGWLRSHMRRLRCCPSWERTRLASRRQSSLRLEWGRWWSQSGIGPTNEALPRPFNRVWA